MSLPALGVQRPLVVQTFRTFNFAVGLAALPIDPIQGQKERLITTFAISNPVGGNSVFLGNSGVTATTGFEIPGGTAPQFSIDQGGRQNYEIQKPLLQIAGGLQCSTEQIEGVPFVVFDLSNMFLIAAVAQTVTIITFPTMYL